MGTVGSTMDIARHLETLGAPEGITVVASSQTRGRGRAGRGWHSPAATGLYCSIVLRPRIPVRQFQAFSIAVGLALCDALDPDRALGLRLKWPNDILHDDRKLAGILVTTGLSGENVDWAILGIGLNLLPDPARPDRAIALSDILPSPPPDLDTLLRSIAYCISSRYESILRDDSANALANWPNRLAWLDRQVAIQDRIGRLRGIDDEGSLLLEDSTGLIAIAAGELTRGPRVPPVPCLK